MDSPALDSLLRLAKTQAAVARDMEARLGGHHGLGFSELRLLLALGGGEEGRRPTDLAADLELTASGVTRAVLPLEKRGIVARRADEGDARASRVVLTAGGRSLLEGAVVTASETAGRLMRRLTVGQMRQLERLLGEIG